MSNIFGNLFNNNSTVVADPAMERVQNTQAPFPASQPNGLASSGMNPSMRQDISVLSHLDTRATQVIANATAETKKTKQALIEPSQLLLGLLYDHGVYELLGKFNVEGAKISTELQKKQTVGNFSGDPTLSGSTKEILEQAYSQAKSRGVDFITPEDILLALFSKSMDTAQFLQQQGLKKEQLEQSLNKNIEFTTGKRSALETYGIDLTEQARAGKLDPIAGRDREVDRMVHILLRRTKNNPIIIGEAGVGKTAIVEGLAQLMVTGKVSPELTSKKIIQLDLSSMIAGASHRGEFEERLKNVIKETQIASGQVILFIDEIHTLIGAGDTGGALDASNIIKPYLGRGQLQIIGTTTTTEYRKYFEKDRAFERRFQSVICEEPSEEVALKMIEIIKQKYETFHKVTFSPEAMEQAVKLSKRYIGERYLPDKAIDLLDEAAAQVKLAQASGQRQDNIVKNTDIEIVVSNWTGIPITKLTEKESEKLMHLEQLIHTKFVNHEMAVKAVAEAVRRGRIGLSNANRPIASFVFLGPTGVGKTELAKTLAEIMFGKAENMIRLDMSEYMEKHEVAKLIGAPPGYVGYEEGGQLTEAVRIKPYSIVLLDEIEKAHPDVFNILLQLLEDGRLTDNKGNTISFKNTVIICTSNIGSNLIQDKLAKKQTAGPAANPQIANDPHIVETNFKKLGDDLMAELRKFFKPELINRFDEVVIFEPLSQDNMMQIALLGIESTKKLLVDQKVGLQITQSALGQLAKEGYEPLYGARPLRRLIQTAIENPIAGLLINRTFGPGDTIMINYDAGQDVFTFAKAQPPVPQPNGQQVSAPMQQPGQPAENLPPTPLPPGNLQPTS